MLKLLKKAAGEAQTWYVKCNGTYRNKLVWAAKYRMETKDQNFYPTKIPFELKKGANTVDFEVTPYCRILDPAITYEDGMIVARFKVEVEDPEQTPEVTVALFGFTDRWVSDGNNNFDFDKQKDGRQKKIKTADGQTVIELKIDPTIESGMQFVYERTHFLRIGALANGNDANANKRYNFSPVYRMSKDFQKVEEVTNWDEE